MLPGFVFQVLFYKPLLKYLGLRFRLSPACPSLVGSVPPPVAASLVVWAWQRAWANVMATFAPTCVRVHNRILTFPAPGGLSLPMLISDVN